MELTLRFAENLVRQREKIGLTPEELATRAELPLADIAAIEAGKQEPDLKALTKVAGSLGVPIGVLVAGLTWDPVDGFGS